MADLLEVINHYKKSIEKSHNDENRLLHCIGKLYKLPVTIHHLQETGIGKTINSLRKFDGEVGIAAKALILKWKAKVAAEESENEGISVQKSDDEPSSSDKEIENTKIYETHQVEIKREKSSKRSNERENDRSHSSHGKDRHRDKEKSSSSSRRSEIKTNHDQNHHHSRSSDKHKDDRKRDSSKVSSSHKHSEKSHSSKSSSHHHYHNEKSSSSSTRKKLNHSHSDNEEEEDNKLIIDIEIKEEKLSDDEKICIKLEDNRDNNRNNEHKNSKKSSSSSSSNDKHRNEHRTSKHSSSSSKSKHREKQLKIEDIKLEPENNNYKSSSDTSNKNNHKSENKSDSSSSRKKRKLSDVDENIVNYSLVKVEDGIDCTAGASFAEALGMMEQPKSTKSISKKIKSNKHNVSTSSNSTSASNSNSSISTKYSGTMEMPSTSVRPLLLAPTVKLEPLESELQLELPIISPHYKPMPLNPIVMDCVFSCNRPLKKNMTDDEALGASISSRTTRTKIYSGMKIAGPQFVPSLHELCIRILQKNIDAIEYTGGVPFDILKPVLERASAEQLFNFEDYNPYLIDDSDMLWQMHCNRKFRGHKRLEYETWRDMFIRCLQEQEAKLMSLTENIKLSQVASVPVKQTKLAYVDSAAKPPRSVQRKQHQFGTDRKLIATPAARVASLSNLTSNIGKIGDARLRVLGSGRDNAQSQPMIFKPKKAPLMAKTIQLMKGRFKR